MELISRNVAQTVMHLAPAAVIVHTITGYTARMVSRFKLPVWIAAVSPEAATCHGLQFSYDVSPIYTPEDPENWGEFAEGWTKGEGLPAGIVVLAEGPSRNNPQANPRMEIFDLQRRG